jgi:cellulose synthase/poly-beta-1,6-N-acetylglucosamine synthase-like glycosyltransferase
MTDTAATIVLVVAAALLVYTYAGYPVLVALVAGCFRRPARNLRYEPPVSLLIAAYNEERSIAWKVRQSRDELDYPAEKLEVVVVSDGSTDRTDEILAGLSDPRLKVLRVGRGGKTAAQNAGVKACTGEIVATADLDPGAVRNLVTLFADPRVGAVSGVCRFVDGGRQHKSGASPTGLGQILYGGYEQAIRFFQARIWTATACSGPLYAVRRELYVPLSPYACSDMMEPIEIVRLGYRVLYSPEAVSHEDTTKSVDDEFRMRVRVVSQGIMGLVAARELLWFWRHPWIAFQLISHKLLRYLMPVLLALIAGATAVLALEHGWARILLAIQLAGYGTALVVRGTALPRRFKLLGLAVHFCTLNAAILAGAREAWRGNQFAAWETRR